MPWQSTEHRDFSGGENLAANPRLLPANQAVRIENALITGYGQVETRAGMTQEPGTGTFPGRIDVLARYRKRDGTIRHIVISGRNLYLADGTVLLSGLGAGPYGTAIMADKFLVVDGVNFYESDGTAAGTKAVPLPTDTGATLNEVKRCTLLMTHYGRLYALGDPQLPHVAYYSQTNRYDYFKSGDMSVVVSTDDSEPIMIAEKLFGGWVAGKRSGWWLITGDPGSTSFQVKQIITGNGPVSRAYVVAGARLYYVAEDGLRILFEPESNTYTTVLIGREHRPLLEAGDLSQAVMIYHDERLLLFYKTGPGSADNDVASVLDLRFASMAAGRYGAWSRITGWPVTAVISTDDGGLLAGLSSGKVVRLFNGTTDLGQPIRMRLWTPEYPLTAAFHYKLFDATYVHVAARAAGSAFVAYDVISGGTRVTHKFPVRGLTGSIQMQFPLHPRVQGLFIQHRIESESAVPITLLAVGERWRPLRAMRAHETEGTQN